MATVTSALATARVSAKRLHAGANVVRVLYVGSANTLSDIILLAKIPNGALVTSMDGTFGTGNADSVMKVGWKSLGATSETAWPLV